MKQIALIDWTAMVLLAMIIAEISVAISKGGPFKKLRGAILSRSPFWGQMIACPYCLSHYVSMAVTIVLASIASMNPLEFVMIWLLLVAGASLISLPMVAFLYVSKLHSLLSSDKEENVRKALDFNPLGLEVIEVADTSTRP